MLSNRIGMVFVSELGKYDIAVAEWRVILTLALHKKASGQEITRRWAMDKMAVNRAIARLERRGLIEKAQNSTDRRTIDLFLTATGHASYQELLPIANARYHELTAGLDKSEVKLLRRLLTKMIAHADAMVD